MYWKNTKGADYSERIEYACVADPAGIVGGISVDRICRSGCLDPADVRPWYMGGVRRHFSWNVLCDSWIYPEYENTESYA